MYQLFINKPGFGSYFGPYTHKLALTMRLTIVLLIVSLMQVSASTFGQQITMNLKKASLESVFREIRKQSGYNFYYDTDVLAQQQHINIVVSKKSIEETLNVALKGLALEYNITGKSISIKKKEPSLTDKVVSLLSGNSRTQSTISGNVRDDKGVGLPGVNVRVKGEPGGVVTGEDGKFNIAYSTQNPVLSFSCIGYISQDIPVESKTVLEVVLQESSQGLDEVVVTAFGIKVKEKALSYAVQEVGGDAVSKVGNPNVLNGLQGKVAGVMIRQSSGSPGNTPAINIRGSRSMTGSNEPLYVVDGLPISGRIIDINPNEIESLSVLKGPTAAALYGLRASNGVVIITTKRGESNALGKPSITFESGVNFDNVTRYPKLQTTYGQGSAGKFGPFDANSWGPRIDEMGVYTNQLGQPEVAAVYDNARDFFQTGKTYNMDLQIAKRIEKGNMLLGVGHSNQDGVVMNSGYKRYTVNVAADYDLTPKFTVSTTINLTSSNTSSIVDGGGNSGVLNAAYFSPVTYHLKGKPIARSDDPYNQINFRTSHDNIYWSIQNNSNRATSLRTFGNVLLDYKPIDWLSFTYRIGLDYGQTDAKQVYSLGSGFTGGRTTPPSGGSILDHMRTSRHFNSNFNVTFDKQLGEDFHINFLAGNEVFDRKEKSLSVTGTDIIIGGFDHISNTSTQRTAQTIERQRIVGFYGNLSLAWKEMLYFNATGRNDIASNMQQGNRSFFYPSVGLAFAFTELFQTSKLGILDFGKIRASMAEVGQVGPIYVANSVFVNGTADSGDQSGSFMFPFEGITGFTIDKTLISSDLKPENTRTIEFGLDLRFLRNRIGLDYTYYQSKSSGQIFRVPVATSTGYASELRNAGQMSVKGHEIVLTTRPIQTNNFSYTLTTNFTSYINKVISLADGIARLELGGSRATIVAEVGQSYPSLRGFGYVRDSKGNVVVDSREKLANGSVNATYGMPLRSNEEIILGSVVPDFEFGFVNQFNYKNLSLSVQIDWRKGGKISSGSNRLGKLYGSLIETEDRTSDYIFPGSKGYFDASGQLNLVGPNDINIVKGETFYRVNQDPIIEASVYDATFVRLREVRLAYDLPAKWIKKTSIANASVYLTGRNLWLSAKLPYFDPELNSGIGNAQGEEYMAYPQVMSFGGGVRVTF